MNRKKFIKICGLLGMSLPVQMSLSSCKDDDITSTDFDGKVIIIGAGAGGLSAGYLLKQREIDFEILEASSVYGGRMKINTDFADFPIPLGAEWLETEASVLAEIVNDETVAVDINTVPDEDDLKFVNSSWFSFFEEYVVPSVASQIAFNTIVEAIDYVGDQVVVTTQNGEQVADKVIVSVPLQVLRDGDIDFVPIFSKEKQEVIDDLDIWEGFKAFFEFSNNFFEEGHEFDISPKTDGQKEYYNASLGQNTSKHILGLFVVGKPALDYTALSDDELKDYILNELDGLFDNQATLSYIKHITQNWNDEPFIKSGYISSEAKWKDVRKLGTSIDNKVYFAGGAYTDGEDWVSVHNAAASAKTAVEEVLA